jgi:diguanylate cyclase (GGDEF)-like protein
VFLSESRISRRLILYIVLFSSIITLCLTGLQLFRDYRYDVSMIESRLDQVELTYLEAINRSAWTLNHQALRLQLEGLLKLPDIIAVQLIYQDDSEPPIRIGTMPAHAPIERDYPIVYRYRGRSVALGTLRVAATLKHVYQRLIDTTLVILVTQAVKTFLVSLFILAVFQRLVTRHLAHIAEFTRRKDLLRSDELLRLHRRPTRLNRDDELTQVTNAINEMASNNRGIVEELRTRHAQLEYIASTDHLTELPNRGRFSNVLNLRLQSHANEHFCVLLADLDGFKDVNDSLGHYAGDLLLKQIRPRLQPLLDQDELVARLGGDEFAFIVKGGLDNGIAKADRIHQAISQPFELLGVRLTVGVSIGLAMYPDHAQDASDLLRFADVAMYAAKNQRQHYRVYNAEENVHSLRRLQLMSDLRLAIETDQLELHYQPKISLNDGQCRGAEALLRWHHPEFGQIPPNEFIPYAEMSDLMMPLTLWVARHAIEDQSRLRAFHGRPVRLALNISSRNLHDPQFSRQMQALCQARHTECCHFILEITESAIMQDPEIARKTISQLADMGFDIAIDDFGTGYSSLAYLKHLPVNELKIDQTFVTDMLDDPNDATIVKSTIDLAHNLGLRVTAEGVEDQPTAERLKQLRCDLAQGYFYNQALPLASFINWASRREREKA